MRKCGSSWHPAAVVEPSGGCLEPLSCLSRYWACIVSFLSQHLVLQKLDVKFSLPPPVDRGRRRPTVHRNTQTGPIPISEGEMDCPPCGNRLAEEARQRKFIGQPKLEKCVPRRQRLLSRAPECPNQKHHRRHPCSPNPVVCCVLVNPSHLKNHCVCSLIPCQQQLFQPEPCRPRGCWSGATLAGAGAAHRPRHGGTPRARSKLGLFQSRPLFVRCMFLSILRSCNCGPLSARGFPASHSLQTSTRRETRRSLLLRLAQKLQNIPVVSAGASHRSF
jgi:hypothetical protein